MLGDFFKIAVEEPEKITRAALRIIKTILLVILAEWLYRQLFGAYELINIGEFKAWAEFVLSCRILIVLGCYFIAKHIILPLLEMLIYLFVVLLPRKFTIPVFDKDSFKNIVSFFNILKFDQENRMPKPGEHIDIFYRVTQGFTDNEEVEAIHKLKDSLLNNVLNLYVFFMVIYFAFVPPELHQELFTGLIIGVLIFLVFMYQVFSGAIGFMQKNHEEIIWSLEMIKAYALIDETLKKYRIKIYSGTIKKMQFFEVGEKQFALLINGKPRVPDIEQLRIYIEDINKQGKYLFFISKKYEAMDTSIVDRLEGKFMVIFYEDYADFEKQWLVNFLRVLSGK